MRKDNVVSIRKNKKISYLNNKGEVVIIPITITDILVVLPESESISKFPSGEVDPDQDGAVIASKILHRSSGLELPASRFTFVLAETIDAVRTYVYAVLIEQKELEEINEKVHLAPNSLSTIDISTLSQENFKLRDFRILKKAITRLAK